jgi:hypothetical protein
MKSWDGKITYSNEGKEITEENGWNSGVSPLNPGDIDLDPGGEGILPDPKPGI